MSELVPKHVPVPVEETVIDDTPVAQVPEIEIDDSPEGVKVVEPEVPIATVVQKTNITQEAPVFFTDVWKEDQEIVDLPSVSDKEAIDKVKSTPNVNFIDSEKGRKWVNTLNNGLELNSFNDAFVTTLEDDTADFRQGVPSNGTILTGSPVKFKSLENETLGGERAILRFMAYKGIGTVYQMPLWHTGIWITFKAPGEGELLELHRQMISDKITFGRSSYGLAYSNTTSYVTDRLVTFALEHIYQTTLKDDKLDIQSLKSIINSQDIPSLLLGLLCSIYPNGFQYRRACIADPEKCNHVVEEKINLSKILWTNTNSLSKMQISHMSSRSPKSKDLASLETYKAELLNCQPRVIKLDTGSSTPFIVKLKTPSIAEYVDSGFKWISNITTIVNSALGVEANDKERNEYIVKQGQASSMRQYLHYVESLEFGSNLVNDKEGLEGIFNGLSSDDIIREEFLTEVGKYINDSAISVVGIPTYDCPECNKEQKSPISLPKHVNIIPIDIYQTFFSLLVQRVQRMQKR